MANNLGKILQCSCFGKLHVSWMLGLVSTAPFCSEQKESKHHACSYPPNPVCSKLFHYPPRKRNDL